MRPDMLAVPQSAVAAAGRALQFTIAELSSRLKVMPSDSRAHSMVAEEMFVMQDAVKAFYSALPVEYPQDEEQPK